MASKPEKTEVVTVRIPKDVIAEIRELSALNRKKLWSSIELYFRRYFKGSDGELEASHLADWSEDAISLHSLKSFLFDYLTNPVGFKECLPVSLKSYLASIVNLDPYIRIQKEERVIYLYLFMRHVYENEPAFPFPAIDLPLHLESDPFSEIVSIFLHTQNGKKWQEDRVNNLFSNRDEFLFPSLERYFKGEGGV